MMTMMCAAKERALTFIDVLIVLATVTLLAGLALPKLAKAKVRRCGGASCINNLKQIGLAMRMFSNDHQDKFPWSVPSAEGGSLEYSEAKDVFRHFLAASNELSSPKVLFCPQDKERLRVTDWSQLSNRNVSYFVGLDADEGKPQTVLSGDRTLSIASNARTGPMVIKGGGSLRVLPGLHGKDISIGFADGSAQQMSEKQFKEAVLKLMVEMREPSVRIALP